MDIEALLVERIKRFEDIKNQIAEISKKIGGLTEQQRALYNQGLELKGGIDALLAIKADTEKALAQSQTAKLTLPEGVKPIVPEAAPVAEVAPAAQAAPEARKEAVTLEVK